MTKYAPNVHGRGSETTATLPALVDEWDKARRAGHDWIPRRSVYVRDGVQPRDVDRETALRYAEIFDELPPITVQRDTFTLIGGRHRLEAASMAGRDIIRVIEMDVADDDLADAAFQDNLTHGRAYQTQERKYYLIYKLRFPDWAAKSDRELARLVGLDRDTVSRLRSREQLEPSRHKSNNPSGRPLGGMPPSAKTPPPVVRSYDPGPDEEDYSDVPTAEEWQDDLDEMAAEAAQDEAEAPTYEYAVSGTVPAKVTLSTPTQHIDKETGEMSSSETFAYLQDDAGVKISVDWFGRASAKRKRAMEAGLDQAIEWLTNVREAL